MKYARQPQGGLFYYQHWVPEEPRGLVVFVHGLGDHIGRYGGLVKEATSAGLAMALFDQRGHGRSGGARGHVERFSDWVNDLAGFIQFSQAAVQPDAPLFIVGAGLGAIIGMSYLLTHTVSVDGIVAVSAPIVPRRPTPAWKKRFSVRFARLFPTAPAGAGFDRSMIANDAQQLAELEADPLFHTRTTLAASVEIDRNLELVMALPHRIRTPMLLLAGGEDAVFDPIGTKRFAARLSSIDKSWKLYDGMPHDLLHGPGSEEVIRDIVGWIAERARGFAPQPQYRLERKEMLWEDVSP